MVDKAQSGHLSTDLRDRPELQAGEVEITPQMIEAGLAILDEGRDSYSEGDLVRRVYNAMRRLESAPQPSSTTDRQ